MFGLVLGRSARDSLFLTTMGSEGLPVMYILNAFFVVLAALLFGHMLGIARPIWMIPLSSALLALLIAVCRLLIALEMPGATAVLYCVSQVVWVISLMQLWILIGDIFDAQLAKRLLPLISISGLIAMMMGGLLTVSLVRLLGTANLLLVWSTLLLVAVPIYRRLILSNQMGRRAVSEAAARRGVLTEIRETPYFRAFIVCVITLWIAVYLADYLFNHELMEHFQKPEEIAGFLGFFQCALGLVALAMQLFLTPRLIHGLGVARVAVVYPSCFIGATALFAAFGGFWCAAVLKYVDSFFFYTTHESVYQLLYTPLSEGLRGLLRSFLDGVVKPCAIAASGLLVYALLYLGVGWLLPWLTLGMGVVWVLAMLRMRRLYVSTLMQNLKSGGRSLQAESLEALRSNRDQHLLDRLLGEAKAEDETRSLAALVLYESVGGAKRLSALKDLLQQGKGEVRAKVISWCSQELHREKALLPLLYDRDPKVVLQALISLGQEKALEPAALESLAEHESPEIRLEVLLQRALLQRSEASLGDLVRRLREGSPEEKIYIFDRLAETGLQGFGAEMQEGLMSADPRIFAAAAKLACAKGYEGAVDIAVGLLHNPQRSQAAEAILVAHQGRAYERLNVEIDPLWPEHLLSRWPRLLIRTGGAEGLSGNIQGIMASCPRIRYYRIQALVAAGGEIRLKGSNLEALHFITTRHMKECHRLVGEYNQLKVSYENSENWSLLENLFYTHMKDMRACLLHLLGLTTRKSRECQLLEPRLTQKNP
ncbi:MAG: hypothetical protein HQL31_04730, partial [Planctomycetes bacterium]|nr:hypothetical protein [Planctomycetota bacterium]